MKLKHEPTAAITTFRGKNAFLSNFYESPIEMVGWFLQRQTALLLQHAPKSSDFL